MDWHSLPPADVLTRLDSGAGGLDEGVIAERRAVAGPNAIPRAPARPWWRTLLAQASSIIVILLLVATAVTAALGRWVDAIAIGAAILVDIVLGFVQERRAERDVARLRDRTTHYCHALRSGVVRRITDDELVPGDIVVIESGDRIPADLRLIDATRLRVDESLLTGESVPVDKLPAAVPAQTPLAERSGMLWAGTLTVSGRGTGVVVETGVRTAVGEIRSLVDDADTPTPLQRLMRRFETRLGIIVGIAAALALGGGLLVGLGPADALLSAISLAIAAIPEGLPVVLTIALSLGVSRMSRRRAIVRTLPAVEALGSTTVIASDKTGTMTMNEQTVQRVWTPIDGLVDGNPDAPLPAASASALRVGALTNESRLDPQTGAVTGEPVDVAIARAALATGAVTAAEVLASPLAHAPYEPQTRCSISVRRTAEGGGVVLLKGAPELVIEATTSMRSTDGDVPLDRGAVHDALHGLTAAGDRVLAVAERRLADGEDPSSALRLGQGMMLVGLIALTDPPRPGVAEAIAACGRAGIAVMMLTGDDPRTAAAIGHHLGLESWAPPVTGTELESLSDREAVDRLRSARIAARVSPTDKWRIVRVLEAAGDVVAVTGDGVNDAPALASASLGVAMGRTGTDVARGCADIVLTDDNFATIVDAVREGRVTFAAVQKATVFLLSTGAAALLAVLGSLLLGVPLLFLPVQMIWFNLVSNGPQDVALAFERGEGDELDRPPRPPRAGLLDAALWRRVAVSAIWMSVAVVATYQLSVAGGASDVESRTLALTAFTFLAFVQAFNSRATSRSVFLDPAGNRLLLGTSLAAIALHVLAVTTPVGQLALGLAPLDAVQWVVAALVGLSVVLPVEADKALMRRADARRRVPGRPTPADGDTLAP